MKNPNKWHIEYWKKNKTNDVLEPFVVVDEDVNKVESFEEKNGAKDYIERKKKEYTEYLKYLSNKEMEEEREIDAYDENEEITTKSSFNVISYIVYIKNHKNSEGELAPWVIKSHEDGHIISSHKTRAEAKKHLKRMQYFKHKKALMGDFGVNIKDINNLDLQAIRKSIIAEYDAVNLYEQLAEKVSDELKEVFLDIANEEKVHIKEFEYLLKELDPEQNTSEIEAIKEVNTIKSEASNRKPLKESIDYGEFKFDPNSTKNEGRFRLRDPKEFKKDTFKRWTSWAGIEAPEGVSFIVGELKNGKKALQAIRFNLEMWDENKAKALLDDLKDEPGFQKYWEWPKEKVAISFYCPMFKIANSYNEKVDIIYMDDIPESFEYKDIGKYVIVNMDKFNTKEAISKNASYINQFLDWLNSNLGDRFIGVISKISSVSDLEAHINNIKKYTLFDIENQDLYTPEVLEKIEASNNSILKKELDHGAVPGRVEYVDFEVKDKKDIENLKAYLDTIEQSEPKNKVINIEYRGVDKSILNDLNNIMKDYINTNYYSFNKMYGPSQPTETPINGDKPSTQEMDDFEDYRDNTPREAFGEDYITTFYPTRQDYTNSGKTDVDSVVDKSTDYSYYKEEDRF